MRTGQHSEAVNVKDFAAHEPIALSRQQDSLTLTTCTVADHMCTTVCTDKANTKSAFYEIIIMQGTGIRRPLLSKLKLKVGI